MSNGLFPKHLLCYPHVSEVHARLVFWTLGRNDEKLCKVMIKAFFLFLLIPGVLLNCGQGMTFLLPFCLLAQMYIRSDY